MPIIPSAAATAVARLRARRRGQKAGRHATGPSKGRWWVVVIFFIGLALLLALNVR